MKGKNPMRIATSTNLFGYQRGMPGYTPTIDCLRRCKSAGFDVIDMNFCPMINGHTESMREEWQEQAKQIRAAADELGMVFNASHLPIYPGLSAPARENDKVFKELTGKDNGEELLIHIHRKEDLSDEIEALEKKIKKFKK